jgi:hypothetical protein
MHRTVFISDSIKIDEFESNPDSDIPLGSWYAECLAARPPLSESDSLYEEAEDILSTSHGLLDDLKDCPDDDVKSAKKMAKDAEALACEISRRHDDDGLLKEIEALHELAKDLKKLLEKVSVSPMRRKKRVAKKRVAGKRVAGKRVAGKRVAGKRVAGKRGPGALDDALDDALDALDALDAPDDALDAPDDALDALDAPDDALDEDAIRRAFG